MSVLVLPGAIKYAFEPELNQPSLQELHPYCTFLNYMMYVCTGGEGVHACGVQ